MITNRCNDRRLGHIVDSVLQTVWTDRERKQRGKENET